MRIVILSAGYGTRLYPLTLKAAKPLIPVNDKPIINFLIDKIDILRKHFPIEEVKIVVNNKFYKDFLAWKKKYKTKVKIFNDGSNSPDDRLGAIKDMSLAVMGKKTDWLVLGGDNLFEDNLVKFVKFAFDKKPYPCVGLYDVKRKKLASRFGVAVLNKRKRMVNLQEKPKRPSSTIVASCVYFFPEQSLDLLDSFISRNRDVDVLGKYIEWLVEETKVFGWLFGGKWIDIGHFDSLKEAEKTFI